MKKIKITSGGCGITSKDASGHTRHTLKTAEHPPFECDDEQADRLVRLGVAKYVGAVKAAEPEAQQGEQAAPTQETEETAGTLSAAELEKMDYNDLKKLAAEKGVKPDGQKKADYIAAILAAEAAEPEAQQEEEDEYEEEDDDEMPDLSTADPE